MDKKDFDFDFDFEKEYGIDPNEFSDADTDLFGDDQLGFDLNDPIFDEAPAQPAPQPKSAPQPPVEDGDDVDFDDLDRL